MSARWDQTVMTTQGVKTQRAPTSVLVSSHTVVMAKTAQVAGYDTETLWTLLLPPYLNQCVYCYSQSQWSVKTQAHQTLVTELGATFLMVVRSFLAARMATSWLAPPVSTVWRLETGTIQSHTAEVRGWVECHTVQQLHCTDSLYYFSRKEFVASIEVSSCAISPTTRGHHCILWENENKEI